MRRLGRRARVHGLYGRVVAQRLAKQPGACTPPLGGLCGDKMLEHSFRQAPICWGHAQQLRVAWVWVVMHTVSFLADVLQARMFEEERQARASQAQVDEWARSVPQPTAASMCSSTRASVSSPPSWRWLATHGEAMSVGRGGGERRALTR